MNSKSIKLLEFPKIKKRLAELCLSDIGSELAEELKPKTDFYAIQALQKETAEAETIRLQKGSMPLSELKDVRGLLKRAELGSILDLSQLILIKKQLTTVRKCKAFMNTYGNKEHIPIFMANAQLLEMDRELEERLENCIISETELSDHASPALKQIRRKIQQKNEGIRSKLNSFIQSSKNQKYLQEAIITIRQERFVVPVKQEYKSMVPGMVHDQSSSGATLFIEPMPIVEMNNALKELKISEGIEIDRILLELTAEVASIADMLRRNQETMQKMDFMMAKGELAVQMKAIEPDLVRERQIHLKNARHPLLKDQEVVPITVKLGDPQHALVITGPNTGGKTVTLKTVGLFVLMTQSGLHLPADVGSRMGIFDEVFADIGDEQSIEQSLSTFSSHMKNIVEILSNVTENSLVLLDELGAGTDPTEGAALAMSILTYLINKRSLVLATTHYSELKQYALMNNETENASVEFDIKTLSPTYRLLIGIPGKSNAFEISLKLGLDQNIIEQAKTFLTKDSIDFEDVLRSIEENKTLAEAESEKAIQLRRQLLERERIISERENKIQIHQDELIAKAKKEAYQLVEDAKKEADRLIEEIRKIREQSTVVTGNKSAERVRSQLREKMSELEVDGSYNLLGESTDMEEANKPVKEGDEVKIPSLNQTGSVISIDHDKKEALVQIGVMKMSLPIKKLVKTYREQQKNKKGLQRIIQHKTEHTIKECDIRGKDLEEALYIVDKYLDDSFLSGHEEITIIHGVGTGVLKQGIQKKLKKHRLVQRYRDGVYGEGGAGVTIVKFNRS
ncbi:DNA mismatch repair protein MutS2 [Tindallia magadiensis]|uniref:Endonuclease MutS2 n=1 Tax=Tindallia magadiensis TaxID=69895 RepID=A0A1I3G168_9FIRM|nr:endonuclease MutS2 [Tindallia magadiensis]SFI17157.1 DNA mismatch repair protein MutS2 [Tindallia magadiensis]